jgi:hypothetical protein
MWKWNEIKCLGAVHGAIGIVYMMIRAIEILGQKNFKTGVIDQVKSTVDFICKT